MPVDETQVDPSSGSMSEGSVYEPGEHIAGRYEVLEQLGRGAHGVVYRVRDLSIDEEIAVKVIARTDNTDGADALRSEVRLARRVTHPNVCRVFDIVEHRHGALLSMEYMRRGTLAERLGTPASEDEVRDVARDVLSGLGAAHKVGIVHRDLKPANILVADGGRLAISDFGIARPLATVSDTGSRGMTGTPAYMSPEQLAAEPLDARTDLYSLGLILYELLGGHLPFVARGEAVAMATAIRRVSEQIPPLDSPLWPAIAALLARDPNDRPPDAAAALALLESPPALVSPPRWRWLLAAAATAAAVIAVAPWLSDSESPRPPGPPAAAARPLEPHTRTLTGGSEMIKDPPAFAPGGDTLLVSSNRSGEFQLWAIDTEASLARRLTTGPTAHRLPQVSGQWLYFLRDVPDKAYDLMRVPVSAIETPPIDASAELVAHGIRYAHVSRSGRILVLDTDTGVSRPGAVELLDPITGERRALTDTSEIIWAYWSPDETTIAFIERFVGEDERGELSLVDVATGQRRSLVRNMLPFSGAAWTDNGASIAFFRGEGDARSLHAVDVATGEERTVARRLRRGTMPTVGPSGKLAYVTDLVDVDVWVYDPDRGLDRITTLGGQAVTSPSWVPETDELAYQVHLTTGYEVRRVRADDTSHVTARRAIDAFNEYIVMTPDGRYAVYGRNLGETWQLVAAEIDSNAPPIVLDEAPAPLGFFPNGVTTDGALITYVKFDVSGSGASELWQVRPDGTGKLKLPGYGGGFRSHDGRWIGFGASTAESIKDRGRLRVYGLNARYERTGESLVIPGTEQFEIYRFGPGNNDITATDARELYRVDFTTGVKTVLAQLPRGLLEPDRMSVHPDGRVAMMLRVGDRRLVVLDNFEALYNQTRD